VKNKTPSFLTSKLHQILIDFRRSSFTVTLSDVCNKAMITGKVIKVKVIKVKVKAGYLM